jgi:hypothetical protein
MNVNAKQEHGAIQTVSSDSLLSPAANLERQTDRQTTASPRGPCKQPVQSPYQQRFGWRQGSQGCVPGMAIEYRRIQYIYIHRGASFLTPLKPCGVSSCVWFDMVMEKTTCIPMVD